MPATYIFLYTFGPFIDSLLPSLFLLVEDMSFFPHSSKRSKGAFKFQHKKETIDVEVTYIVGSLFK